MIATQKEVLRRDASGSYIIASLRLHPTATNPDETFKLVILDSGRGAIVGEVPMPSEMLVKRLHAKIIGELNGLKPFEDPWPVVRKYLPHQR
jgi:hypothetical protein